MQIADEVSNGLVQGSGGFRMADEVRKVPVQTADKVAEVSGADSRRSCGGFRYKNLPKSSKLLGITHEFICSWFISIYDLFIYLSIHRSIDPSVNLPIDIQKKVWSFASRPWFVPPGAFLWYADGHPPAFHTTHRHL